MFGAWQRARNRRDHVRRYFVIGVVRYVGNRLQCVLDYRGLTRTAKKQKVKPCCGKKIRNGTCSSFTYQAIRQPANLWKRRQRLLERRPPKKKNNTILSPLKLQCSEFLLHQQVRNFLSLSVLRTLLMAKAAAWNPHERNRFCSCYISLLFRRADCTLYLCRFSR